MKMPKLQDCGQI